MFSSNTARLTIDLGAIVRNYKNLAARIKPAKALCVVKADAYGLGATQVTAALIQAGAQDFFVAMLTEALVLREALGSGFTIYVLDGFFPEDLQVMHSHNIRPVVNTLEQIYALHRWAQKQGVTMPGMLHVDTGMSRLGLQAADVALLEKEPHWLGGLEVQYILSHLACAGGESAFNQAQRDRFAQIQKVWPQQKFSLLASEGVLMQNLPALDACRLGLSLYTPPTKEEKGLQSALTLQGRIVQIRSVSKGTPVGYDSTFVTKRPSRIATLGIGFADGYMRACSNAAKGYFKGYKVPVVGRVSMDLTTVDVTDVPDAKIAVGDWVELVGPHCPLLDLPVSPYEFLVRLSARAQRIYKGSALTSEGDAA